MEDDRDGDHALVGPQRVDAKLRLAETLDGRRPDEIVLLDRRGRFVSRRSFRRRIWAIWAIALGLLVEGVVTQGLTSVIFPFSVVGTFLVLSRPRFKKHAQLRRARNLALAWRDEEARAELLAIASPGGAIRIEVERMLAAIDGRRGDFAAALDHIDRAIEELKRRKQTKQATYWICLGMRFDILVELDVDRAAAALPELAQLPATAYFRSVHHYAALAIAFHRDDPRALPDDLTLHDWARTALATNGSACRLALLAWAFDRRGDREMSEHLLEQVPAHLHVPFDRVAPGSPKLHRWVTSQPKWKG